MAYGAETLTARTTRELELAQYRMGRSMLGISLRDYVTNENLNKGTGVADVGERICQVTCD